MAKITITKGKILKGDIVEISFNKIDGVKNKPAKCSEEHTAPPHPDFVNALSKLTPHAILLGEFVPTSDVKSINKMQEELLNNYHVSGFSMGKDDSGVTITAQKTLSSGKTLGFNTPFVVFADDSESAYPFSDELQKAITKCRKEMELYLGGKYKEDNQGDIFAGEK